MKKISKINKKSLINETIDDYLNDELVTGDNSCGGEHHHCHGHGHGQEHHCHGHK